MGLSGLDDGVMGDGGRSRAREWGLAGKLSFVKFDYKSLHKLQEQYTEWSTDMETIRSATD